MRPHATRNEARTSKAFSALAPLCSLALLAAIGAAFVPSAAADVLTGCVPATADVLGQVLVGDGPLVGDAPDDVSVPVAMGCYTGAVSSPTDVDSFQLLPGWHNVVPGAKGTVIRMWSLSGCVDADLVIQDVHTHGSFELCAGGPQKALAVLGTGHTILLNFTAGPGVYAFLFE